MLRRFPPVSSISVEPYLWIALIAFCGGAIASFLAGMMTRGIAAAYALVGMRVWGIAARLGGAALANDRLVLVTAIALVLGLIFSIIVTLGGLAFPKLRKAEWGRNVLLIATITYGVWLAFAFPLKDTP